MAKTQSKERWCHRMNYTIRVTDHCNLNCKYCYAKTDDPHTMSIATLRKVLTNIILHEDPKHVSDITIHWTGGEPLLQDIGFFREIVEVQKVFFTDVKWTNIVATNLTLLTEEFIKFFFENNFQLRTSLDLPQQNHDDMRTDNNFFETLAKIHVLQASGIAININTVVTSQNIDKAEEIYDFLKRNMITSFSVSRFVLQGNAVDSQELLIAQPGQFGGFLVELFDLWMADTDGCLERITPLDNILEACKFHLKQIDVLQKPCFHCQDQIFSINPLGDVFPSCNKFLAHAETCFGNITENSLNEIFDSESRQNFLDKVTGSTGQVCPTCKYNTICQGGCYFLAYAANLDDNIDREDFCKGYYFVFDHIVKYLEGVTI